MKFGYIDILAEGKPPWMAERQYAALCTAGREVALRTGTRMLVSYQHNRIAWCYDAMRGIPSIAMDVRLFEGDKPTCLDPVNDGTGVEDLVWTIQLGKVDRKLKDKWRAIHNRRREDEAKQRRGRWLDERRSRAMREVEKVHRRLRMSTAGELARWQGRKV